MRAETPSELEAVEGDEALLRLRVDACDDLDVLLEPGAAELRLQQLVHLVDAGRVVHGDLDQNGSLLAVLDLDALDGRRRERVDRHAAVLERDARAALGHVERIRDAEDAGLERERPPVLAVARDRLEDLRADDGQVGLLVQPLEELPHLRLGEEEAPVLVAVAGHGPPHAVQEGAPGDDDLGVLPAHALVAHHARLDAVLHQLAQELEPDVRDDLDMDPGVVVDLQPLDRVHVGHVPPRLELGVGVHALDELAERPVRARRDVDPHPLHRLRRREERLLLGLLRDRLLDALLGLGIELGHGAEGTSYCSGRPVSSTAIVCRSPPRTISSSSRPPGFRLRRVWKRSSTLRSGSPSAETITSPGSSPAASAPEPSTTDRTATPSSVSRPACCASWGDSGAGRTPRKAWLTSPSSRSCVTTSTTVGDGIAKPIATAWACGGM